MLVASRGMSLMGKVPAWNLSEDMERLLQPVGMVLSVMCFACHWKLVGKVLVLD